MKLKADSEPPMNYYSAQGVSKTLDIWKIGLVVLKLPFCLSVRLYETKRAMAMACVRVQEMLTCACMCKELTMSKFRISNFKFRAHLYTD